MQLIKPKLAKPKWIRDQEPKRWWEMKEPKKAIKKDSPYETPYERANWIPGSIALIIYGVLFFGFMVGLVLFLKWV